jgi:hypothetical protein
MLLTTLQISATFSNNDWRCDMRCERVHSLQARAKGMRMS